MPETQQITRNDYIIGLLFNEDYFKRIEQGMANVEAIASQGLAIGEARIRYDIFKEIENVRIAAELEEIGLFESQADMSLIETMVLISLNGAWFRGDFTEEVAKNMLESEWVFAFGFEEGEIDIECFTGEDIAIYWKDLNIAEDNIDMPSFFYSLISDEAGGVFVFKDGKQVTIKVGLFIWEAKGD